MTSLPEGRAIFKIKKTFSNMRSLFICIVFVLQAAISAAQSDNPPYKVGESLTYIVNYKWGAINTDVGEAVTNLSFSDGHYHSVIKGRTFKFYDIFFKVREHFESKFTQTPVKPYYFYRNTYEGKYHMQNTFYFNPQDNVINAKIQKYDRTPKDTLLKGTGETYDLVSLFYKVRSIDFNTVTMNVRIPISFAIDSDVYNLYFIYQGKEVKKIQKLGTFNTLKFAVKLVAGSVFTGEEEMTIWVTDDLNKIPLLFEAPILVGRVQGRLSSYKNVKYPLSSKIK